MCGFAGYLAFKGAPPTESLLRDMGNRIAHRGRDFQGVYLHKQAGLVHQRLSILDIGPDGHQPKITDDGKIAIVFNGEIVNYIELRLALQQKNVEFSTQSDTEVLLKGYATEGKAFFSKLRGFFAFAILDWRSGELLLARDPCGIKPLYYTQQPDGIWFASEVKALFADARVTPQVSAVGLQDYVTMQSYLPGHTLFDGIDAVLPGHTLTLPLLGRTVQQHPYWHMPAEDEQWKLSYKETVEELRAIIEDTIAIWSRSDVAIGSYISGGIDSSMVASYTSRHTNTLLQKELYSFSSLFEGELIADERSYSDMVATHIGSDHARIFLDEEIIIRDHDDIIYALDMPVAGYCAPYRSMAREVRKKVRVVMTGHGGDELAAGYPKYVALHLAHDLSQAARGLPTNIHAEPMRYLTQFEAQARQILGKAAFADDYTLYHTALDRSSYLWSYVNPVITRGVHGRDVVRDAMALVPADASMLRKLLHLDFQTLLPALLHVEDRTSMIENLESRPPLLDSRIIEYLARVPTSFLLHHGLKSLLRDAAKAVVPSALITNTRKSGVMYPVMQLFNGRMKEQVCADISSLNATGLFTLPVEELLAGRHQGINQRDTWALWSLARWFIHFKPSIG